MPSEQPREGTQKRYIDQWPKPMFLCTHCDEQTDSDPCQECASVFDERGENYPPVLRFQVVPAPAQPDPYPAANPSLQERGSASGASEQIEPSPNYAGSARSRAGGPAPPRGEGDDLAARLDGDRLQEWFTEIQASASLLPEDLQIIEAMIARASTHPEQWGGSIRGCSPSSTRTPPTNAGRRGLAGSTDTNAPRGSCSNEPMPR